MKIYFTCSTAEFETYQDQYWGIRNFLVSEKHILTRDWMHKFKTRIDSGDTDVLDIKEIYEDCMRAIRESDMVIIEDTVSNFSTGHQITVALQQQKPTLVLWSKPKHRYFKNTFINGIDSEFLECHEYTSQEYENIIKKFIKKFSNAKQKNRFHLVLSEVERKYLDWAQFNTHKSRTSVIKDAIRTKISEDEDYQRYLGT
jgi:antirestriction protein